MRLPLRRLHRLDHAAVLTACGTRCRSSLVLHGAGCRDESEVVDALGEIANMVGGNVKSMLPGPSTLSLPSVVQGQLSVPGTRMVREVQLSWRAQPLFVSLVAAGVVGHRCES